MPGLVIRIGKRGDGRAVLRCERADGTVTWQRQDGPRAEFFPYHDLTHYAVETVLGLRRGFFGLVAEGWDIAETEGQRARGPLPAEAILAEHIVGWLDAERASRATWGASELNEYLAQRLGSGALASRGAITDAELVRVRSLAGELQRRWADLPPDASLDLDFAPGSPRRALSDARET